MKLAKIKTGLLYLFVGFYCTIIVVSLIGIVSSSIDSGTLTPENKYRAAFQFCGLLMLGMAFEISRLNKKLKEHP